MSELPLFGSPPRLHGAARRAPQLLVSVRDAHEARAAIEGGCRLLDVKDPSAGALGFAGRRAVESVANEVRGQDVTLSVAAGEVSEWRDVEPPPLMADVAFAKLGLAGQRGNPHWIENWRSVRRSFDAARGASLNWVAVAYADHEAADAPSPEEILAAAVREECAGLLVDTWSKSAGTLFDFLSMEQLRELTNSARRSGLFSALAGRLRRDQIVLAIRAEPDVVAVRSAACRGGDRRYEIEANAVRALRLSLSSASPAIGSTPRGGD